MLKCLTPLAEIGLDLVQVQFQSGEELGPWGPSNPGGGIGPATPRLRKFRK